MKSTIKSPIRWLGGKSKSIKVFSEHFPKKIATYYEPFVGGGSVLFWLLESGIANNAVASDANYDLINFYVQLQENPDDLYYYAKLFPVDAETFRKIRSWDRDGTLQNLSLCERAARFLYLNKTSFQGMWRQSRAGFCNQPYGRPSKYNLDLQELKYASNLLQSVLFKNEDYEKVVQTAESGDFVYFDPPYYPMSETSGFVTYNPDGFNYGEHYRLKNVYSMLKNKGVSVALSNSDSDTIRSLYTDENIVEIDVKRMVAAKSSSRGAVKELLITSF